MKWIRGIHILSPENEDIIPRLVKESGLKDTGPSVLEGSGNGHHKPHFDRSASKHASALPGNVVSISGSFRTQNLTQQS
jgi:hypothetical protein